MPHVPDHPSFADELVESQSGLRQVDSAGVAQLRYVPLVALALGLPVREYPEDGVA